MKYEELTEKIEAGEVWRETYVFNGFTSMEWTDGTHFYNAFGQQLNQQQNRGAK